MAEPQKMSAADNQCMQCAEPTRFKCKGCEEGLDVHGEPCEAFYCSKQCQTAHWETHKSLCKNARYRKQLFRTGEIAQKIFMDIRKAAFTYGIKTVEKKEGIIYLENGLHVDSDVLFKFPEHMFASPEDHEVVLSHTQGPPALMILHKLVTSALQGSYKKIHCVCASVPTEKDRIVCTGPGVGPVPHTIFKVNLKDGNSYVLDVCGAQYGIHQSVMLWDDYCSKMALRIVFEQCAETGTGAFGTARERYNFRLLQRRVKEGQSDVDYTDLIVLFYGNVIRCAHTAINTSLANYKTSTAELLKLSGIRYKQQSEGLTSFVKDHVQTFTEMLMQIGVIHYMTLFPNVFEFYLERMIKTMNTRLLAKDEASRLKNNKILARYKWPDFANAFRELEPKEEEEQKFRLVDQGDVLHIFPA